MFYFFLSIIIFSYSALVFFTHTTKGKPNQRAHKLSERLGLHPLQALVQAILCLLCLATLALQINLNNLQMLAASLFTLISILSILSVGVAYQHDQNKSSEST